MGRPQKRRLTIQHPTVDVHQLHRSEQLKPGQGLLLSLSSPKHHAGNTADQVEEEVALDWTPCYFGGYRPWFICPGCWKRVTKLYAADGRIFRCRLCHGLHYLSQRENRDGRRLTRAQAICRRLTGSPVGDFRIKPKGMHQTTWARLVRQYLRFESESWAGIIESMAYRK